MGDRPAELQCAFSERSPRVVTTLSQYTALEPLPTWNVMPISPSFNVETAWLSVWPRVEIGNLSINRPGETEPLKAVENKSDYLRPL